MQFSGKRMQIDRAKAITVGSVGTAVFLVIFSFIGSKALLSQRGYQSRVTKEQEKAVKQLRENIKATEQLDSSYKTFVGQSTNVLGGNSSGQGDKDGNNAKIILNALPSKYDFPALATSLEKILIDRSFKIESISGTDDEVAQSASTLPNGNQVPVEIPFRFSVKGSYDSLQSLVDVLERSIRPFNIRSMSLSGKNSTMQIDIDATTYYLPEKQLNFPTKVVK